MSKLQTAWDTLRMGSQWLRLEWQARGSSLPAARGSRRQDGRHLALFAWALPPNSNAGVHRPLSFLRHGSRLGWTIDAFHGEVPANQSQHGGELLARIPENVRLHAVPRPSRQASFRLTPRIDGGFDNALASARCAIEKLALDPPDVVLASGPPFYVFVAAYFVARHFGVPLVLDYRDEWTECPFGFVDAGPQDRHWERRCLATAAAVLFTTRSHRQHQLACFSELSPEKAHLIPNGWETDDFPPCRQGSGKPADALSPEIEIAHVGNLAEHTPPADFLKALAELLAENPAWRQRVTVSFIGRRSPQAAAQLAAFPYPGNLRLVDHLGKQEATRRMQQADILLLIAAPELARYLPGKLFDYVAARRPLLVFGAAGESSAVVEQLGIGKLCRPGSGTALAAALEFLQGLPPCPQAPAVETWLECHRRDRLAGEAFRLFTALA